MATSNVQVTEPEVYIPKSIVFTDSAALKVAKLIQEEGNLELKLRVYITGGGCSGFQYGFAFEEETQDDDTVIEKQVKLASLDDASAISDEDDSENDDDGGDDGGEGTASMTVQLLVDPMSYQYLVGAEIDYVEDINGERFIIRNPNAQTTCGCGSSFSM